MDGKKIYLLAEVTVRPGFLEDVKGALKQALGPTLHEAGCEGLFETSREDDPRKRVFFEIFSSAAAHKFHLFTALEGKLAGATIMTKLNTLQRHREEFRSFTKANPGPRIRCGAGRLNW